MKPSTAPRRHQRQHGRWRCYQHRQQHQLLRQNNSFSNNNSNNSSKSKSKSNNINNKNSCSTINEVNRICFQRKFLKKNWLSFEKEWLSIFMTALYNAFHCYATSNVVVVVVLLVAAAASAVTRRIILPPFCTFLHPSWFRSNA